MRTPEMLPRLPESGWMPKPNMVSLQRSLLRCFKQEQGSTAVEYALILGLICSVMLASVRTLGNSSMATLSKVTEALGTASEHATMESSIDGRVGGSVSAPTKK